MKSTFKLLYQVSHYIRVEKQRNIKCWDQLNHLVIRGFCYSRPLYNEVSLYMAFIHNLFPFFSSSSSVSPPVTVDTSGILVLAIMLFLY